MAPMFPIEAKSLWSATKWLPKPTQRAELQAPSRDWIKVRLNRRVLCISLEKQQALERNSLHRKECIWENGALKEKQCSIFASVLSMNGVTELEIIKPNKLPIWCGKRKKKTARYLRNQLIWSSSCSGRTRQSASSGSSVELRIDLYVENRYIEGWQSVERLITGVFHHKN